MDPRHLPLPAGYDPRTQAVVGTLAAALDDQSALLRRHVSGMGGGALEWQLRPGMNTVGMLLAHMAVAEFYWINIAAAGLPPEVEGEALSRATLGIGMDDDGLPLAAEGTHPPALKGRTLESYLQILDGARAAIHSTLRGWSDADLDRTFKTWAGNEVSRRWALYHVLEHFSGHFGQILLLKHLMIDAGVLVPEKST